MLSCILLDLNCRLICRRVLVRRSHKQMQLLDRVAISENYAFTQIDAFESFILVAPTHPIALQVMTRSSNSTTA